MVPGMVVDVLVATHGPNPKVMAGKKVSDAPPTKKNAMAAKKHDKPFFKRNEPEAPWEIRRLAREREKDAAAAKASAANILDISQLRADAAFHTGFNPISSVHFKLASLKSAPGIYLW